MWALGCAAAMVYGCSSDDDGDSSATNSGSGASGANGSGGTGNTGGASVGGTGTGGTTPGFGDTQCTDGVDNDMDGFTDSTDVECVGPLDNDEGSFATGIPGDNSDPCKQDCFFDGNSGAGDDGCNWDLKCDPLSPGDPECPYDETFNNCPEGVSQKCLDFCGANTPNGCDCFGCCEIVLPDATVTVYLGSPGCNDDTLTDPEICKPCTQVGDCNNDCGTCEYCLGKTELPPECTPDGGGTGPCDDGVTACTTSSDCPTETPYCLTGCCIAVPD
jgi:hypothetical protein